MNIILIKRYQRYTLMSVAFALLLAVAFGASSCGNPQKSYPNKMGSITIGMEATPVNSLIYVAENRKYFEENGLNVTIDDSYPSGAAAVEGLSKGKVDIATASEFVMVRQACEEKRVTVLASIDMFMHMKLVGRKDRGIKAVSDLKGKRIGVPLKTAADFELGRFLDLQGIKKEQISIVDIQAPQAVDALTKGEIDAVVVWQPNVMAIEDRLGDKAIVWSVQSDQPMYCIAIANSEWASNNPDQIKSFLRSLGQAEDYVTGNRTRARAIVQKRLGYDDRYIEIIWPEHKPSLKLNQSLILAMEDQSRWLIKSGLTDIKTTPDFLDYIAEDNLKSLRPESVNIIRGE